MVYAKIGNVSTAKLTNVHDSPCAPLVKFTLYVVNGHKLKKERVPKKVPVSGSKDSPTGKVVLYGPTLESPGAAFATRL